MVSNWYADFGKDPNMDQACKHIVERILMQNECDSHMRISGELISAADNGLDFF